MLFRPRSKPHIISTKTAYFHFGKTGVAGSVSSPGFALFVQVMSEYAVAGGEPMLESALLLLMNSLLLMLRIVPGESFAKPLSREDEQKYLELWAAGDIDARNKLVEHNMRLVSHIMKKYFTQTDDVDDLISIGTIGLIKGVNTYRPDRGVRLATYASRCIENEILMHFRSVKKSMSDVSLSEALDVDSDGDGLSILDVLACEEDMAEQIGSRELCRELGRCIDECLTEREAKIVRLRYGLAGTQPMPQRDVAKLCGISRSYVSRIEKRALEKLRAELGEDACPT